MKRHEDFDKSLTVQEEKVKAVDEVGSRLLQADHPAADDIDHRRKEVANAEPFFQHCSTCLSPLGPGSPQ